MIRLDACRTRPWEAGADPHAAAVLLRQHQFITRGRLESTTHVKWTSKRPASAPVVTAAVPVPVSEQSDPGSGCAESVNEIWLPVILPVRVPEKMTSVTGGDVKTNAGPIEGGTSIARPVSSPVLHDAELTGAESGLGAIADVEFGEDVGDVVLDGAFGEVEAIGDFLI